MEEADQLADTIAVLHKGQIIATGTASELKSRVSNEVMELRNAKDEVFRSIPTSGNVYEITQTLTNLIGTVPSDTRLSIRRPSMDDVFLFLTSEEQEAM